MAIEPSDLTELGKLFDQKLQAVEAALAGTIDRRIAQTVEASLVGTIDRRVAERFEAEIAIARQAVGAARANGHTPSGNGHRPVPELADYGLGGDGGGMPPVDQDQEPPAKQPPREPMALVKANALAVGTHALLSAIEADPVGSIGALLDQALNAFLKFRQAMAPHPFDQARTLATEHPDVVALWAPNPLGLWQQQLIAQSMLLGANAAKGMKSELRNPSPGGQWPETPSSVPSGGPSNTVSGPSLSSGALSPVPPGMPQSEPALMSQRLDLAQFARRFGK